MDIDLLRTFAAICDTGSFTAAAQRVGRTQSAVSLQIRRLEESLGRPLFVRTGGAIAPTEHGVLLLGHARDILQKVDAAVSVFNRGTVEGIVVLGMPDDYTPRILSRVLKGFTELYPAATINLVIDESRVLVKHLAEGSVDLAFITEGEGPVSGGPVAFRDSIVWTAPASGELHQLDPLPLAIWDENDGYARRMLAALQAMDRRYRLVVISRSMTGLRGAVRAGLAVTAMMRSSLGEGMRELGALDGFPPLAEVSIRLERAHLKKSAIIDRLEMHLLSHFGAPD
jgi:DNA-binding transcriptional LysR family regulator